jgi:hypothetical protein
VRIQSGRSERSGTEFEMAARLLSLLILAVVPAPVGGSALAAEVGSRGAVRGLGPVVEERLRAGARPRLAVVVALDLFRADALRRWPDLLLPARDSEGRTGGFRWLMTEGTWFADSRFTHVPSETASGHAVLLSGAEPYASGIVGNEWFDRGTGRTSYCVEDPRGEIIAAAPVGSTRRIGPANLRVSTVGDELEMATDGRAKTVSIALKDRSAVLMAGHAADLAIWLDAATLQWVSSRAYLPEGPLPSWVGSEEATGPMANPTGRVWKPLPETARALREGRARPLPLPGWRGPLGLGSSFPHRVRDARAFEDFLRTPFGDEAVFAAARAAVRELGMGNDDVPDLLTMGLSSGDWIGHGWGPYSAQSLDAFLRADRGLAEFLRFLESEVPGGLDAVVVVVSSDHGISTPPEDLSAFGMDALRIPADRFVDAAEGALDQTLGEADWIAAFHEPYLWFTDEALSRAPSREALEEIAGTSLAKLPGVYAVFPRSELLSGRAPATSVGRAVSRGFHPARSGDLTVILEPFALSDLSGGSVGAESPYPANHAQGWAHDSEVPILVGGFGLPAVVRADRVTPASIAPTLALLLGIARPSGSDAPILY